MENSKQYPVTRENIEDCAISTILNIWTMIDWDKVDGKRAMGIWEELASKVGSSAKTTNNYEKFVTKLCRKFEIRELRYKDIAEISNQSDEFKQGILKLLREETQLLILKVKLKNEIRKEENKQKQLIREREEKLNQQLNQNINLIKKEDVNINED